MLGNISIFPVFSISGIFLGPFPCFPCAVGTLLDGKSGHFGLGKDDNESMVSFVSRRYMRVVNGILVVLLI